MSDLDHIRREYALKGLDREDLLDSPVALFQRWFQDALDAKVHEPNAMTLATVQSDGRPAARIVLLKGLDERGFCFFTNYDSDKGLQLSERPVASLVFFWPEMERQVRVEGPVGRVSTEESEDYFHKRPRGAQIGAWASDQSRVIPDRAWLEGRMKELEKRFENEEVIPLPEHWGGFRVTPEKIEFWQGRPNRLHDRFRYSLDESQEWRIERLSP